MMLDWMVSEGMMSGNPAASERGPRYSPERGKTPVLSVEQARILLESIEDDPIGRRDRTLLGVMLNTFAGVGAVVRLRLEEKGGKVLAVPVHGRLERMLED
jgi:site-specific recombinase XerC